MEGVYRITKEMLAIKLGIKEKINSMTYDFDRGIAHIWVSGDNLEVERAEGDSTPVLRLDFRPE